MKKNKPKINIDIINYRIKKISKEILDLTDQQSKHRQKIADGCTDKYIKKFVSEVNKMIINADKQLQLLLKQKQEFLND